MSDNGLTGRTNVAVWDEHRNSSRVFGVPPHALEDARRELDWLRRNDPKLVDWLAAGAPPIHSDDEHIARFGVPYGRRGRR